MKISSKWWHFFFNIVSWICCCYLKSAWWRHQMETFSALLAICAGNSPVPGEFPTQRPVTRSFDIFFDLHLNKLLSKQSWGWWLETLSCPLWRQRNGKIQCSAVITLSIFLENPHKIHHIAHPLRCLLWVHTLIYMMPGKFQRYMHYHVILERTL